MIKEYPVRYGNIYKVVLAIVLPCLLIIPFIMLMQPYKHLEEWKAMLIIFVFLGFIMSLCLCLVFNVYPAAILRMDNKIISLSFNKMNPLAPRNFSFHVNEITSLTRREIGGDEYFVFKLRSPARKFQISASSRQWEVTLDLDEAMDEIASML